MTTDHDLSVAPRLWRIASAARLLGMAPRTLTQACAAGDIPFNLQKVGRMWYVRSSEVLDFIRARHTSPKTK
jgi:hypothetical protein